MKGKIVTGFILVISLAIPLTAEPQIPAEIYPSFGLVTDVSETSWGAYIITVSDFEGFSYAYYAEDGDLEIGDGMALLMYNNGSPDNILDDVVAEARYVGHIDYWTDMAYTNTVSEIYCGEDELISE